MGQSQAESSTPLYNIKLSTVGSGRATGPDVTLEPTGSDLAVKLHYLKALYLFNAEAARGLTVPRVKEAMFYWFDEIYWTCGRFRRNDQGRPYIKCNDCGARFVEGMCDKTVEEWLSTADRSVDELLVYHLPVGPELAFSPLIYIQMTRFKCGGMSMGLSWAHVLSDPFSFSDFFNRWADIIAGVQLNIPTSSTRIGGSPDPKPFEKEPVSIKHVDPVGDLWVTPNNRKMATFCFPLTATQISYLQSKFYNNDGIPVFESLCAIIWKCLARVREEPEPKTVTIIKKDPCDPRTKILSNSQIISWVEANFSVADANVEELAKLLMAQATDERARIDETVESDKGVSDFIVYGAKLTFADLGGVALYELKLNGYGPDSVYYNIQGIGDEGAVLVLPGAKGMGKGSGEGRVVTVTLPEEEMVRLKFELKGSGVVLESDIIE